jgi:hypothetical protein
MRVSEHSLSYGRPVIEFCQRSNLGEESGEVFRPHLLQTLENQVSRVGGGGRN